MTTLSGDPLHRGRIGAWYPVCKAHTAVKSGSEEAAMKTILVPLDGSALAEQVLPYVYALAPVINADIHLLRVVKDVKHNADADLVNTIASMYGTNDPLVTELQYQMDLLDQRRLAAQNYLTARAEALGADGLIVTTEVRVGPPADVIVEVAETAHVTMIAMVTHGYSGLKRWALGSVTDKVIHATATPVLVVRGQEKPATQPYALRRIVVPLDGSELARQALPLATELAYCSHADLLLLHATDVRVVPHVTAQVLDRAPDLSIDSVIQVRRHAEEYLHGIADTLPRNGSAIVPIVVSGPPAECIIDEAATTEASLIVMATHGYSGLRRWALGSIADKVLQASKIPLLLVRAK